MYVSLFYRNFQGNDTFDVKGGHLARQYEDNYYEYRYDDYDDDGNYDD